MSNFEIFMTQSISEIWVETSQHSHLCYMWICHKRDIPLGSDRIDIGLY